MSKSFINVDTEQAVISAIPALLRFVVTNSIVAMMFSPSATARGALRCAIRVDVDIDAEQIGTLPETCHLTSAENSGAILVAVCDPEHDAHALHLLHVLRAALHDRDIRVLQMLTTHSLTATDRWTDPDSGAQGPTIPYTDAAITAEVVVAGDTIGASREDIDAEFALAAPAPYTRVDGDFDDLVRTTATELHQLITGRSDAAGDLATRAAILVTEDVHLRDALLRIGQGHEMAAGRVWTALAAELRDMARAHVLTVAAFNFYAGGDGPRAGIALDHARAAVAHAGQDAPHLATLLDTALQALIDPANIRALVPSRDQRPIPGTNL